MASVEQCEQALQSLADKLAAVDPDTRSKYVVERTVSCRVRDLDVCFRGRVDDEGLTGIELTEDPSAQVRLATSSDDLVALADGTLDGGTAYKSGRLKVSASLGDMLKLRSLL